MIIALFVLIAVLQLIILSIMIHIKWECRSWIEEKDTDIKVINTVLDVIHDNIKQIQRSNKYYDQSTAIRSKAQ